MHVLIASAWQLLHVNSRQSNRFEPLGRITDPTRGNYNSNHKLCKERPSRHAVRRLIICRAC
jgi:hypothetical protein